MRQAIGIIVLAGLLTAATFPALPWSDRARLQGSWVVVSGPTEDLKGSIYTFDGDTVRIQSQYFQMDSQPYRLETGKTPREIDIVMGGGGKRPQTIIRGIYQLNGDELRLCTGNWQPTSDTNGQPRVVPGPRPVGFNAAAGSFVILKRQGKN